MFIVRYTLYKHSAAGHQNVYKVRQFGTLSDAEEYAQKLRQNAHVTDVTILR